MTKRYLGYSKLTGEVLGAKDRFESPVETDEVGYIESQEPTSSYVENGTVHPKQPFPVTPGMTMAGVPVGTQAEIEGTPYVVDDGVIELDTNAGMPIAVRLRHPRYLTISFEVTP